jgi:hexosaminidase
MKSRHLGSVLLSLCFAGGWGFGVGWATAATPGALMPLPRTVVRGNNALTITRNFTIDRQACGGAIVARAVGRFQAAVDRRIGEAHTQGSPALTIRCGNHASEAYLLKVTASGIVLTADGPSGVLYGLSTLRQALVRVPVGLTIPEMAIDDAPRFTWRGVMIDVARHFMSVETLKRQIDAMEAVKLNVLHLHLSDNEAFRVESRRYPLLQTTISNGEYYTQTQIRDLVTYAADRGIRVVPEFDMPGHMFALLTAYPEFAAGPVPTKGYLAGANVALDPTKPATYRFLDRLIGEMATLFPDRYFHVGGDEVGAAAWAAPRVQMFMTEHKLATHAALQGYFAKRLHIILRRHGKTMVGWDELAEAGMPGDVVIQSWRSSRMTAVAARGGHPVIVSAGYYLDLLEPAAFHYGNDPLDPTATGLSGADAALARKHPLLRALVSEAQIRDPNATLTRDEAARVIGGEAALWSELVDDEMLDGRLWPRLAAIAERFWSDRAIHDETDMYRRLVSVQEGLRLDGLMDAVNQQRMIARLAPGDSETVAVMLGIVTPVRNFAHRQAMRQLLAGQPVTEQSLATVADAAPADSLAARRFEAAVRHYLNDHVNDPTLKAQLTQWRDNGASYAVAARIHPALAAALPVSIDITALAQAGLDAIDFIERGTSPSTPWRMQTQTLLDRQAHWEAASRSIVTTVMSRTQPPADLLIAIVPGIRALVTAANRK